jgi:hypothetical protein
MWHFKKRNTMKKLFALSLVMLSSIALADIEVHMHIVANNQEVKNPCVFDQATQAWVMNYEHLIFSAQASSKDDDTAQVNLTLFNKNTQNEPIKVAQTGLTIPFNKPDLLSVTSKNDKNETSEIFKLGIHVTK